MTNTELDTKLAELQARVDKAGTHYVLGFAFRDNCTSVVLIRKQKPKWQAGLLNGIGGKVEAGESPEQAMSREFKEECGVDVHPSHWRHYARMSGEQFAVDCFTLRDSDVWEKAASQESEQVEKIHPDELDPEQCISNLPWLIELAVDENEGRFHFANIRYAKPYIQEAVSPADLRFCLQTIAELREELSKHEKANIHDQGDAQRVSNPAAGIDDAARRKEKV